MYQQYVTKRLSLIVIVSIILFGLTGWQQNPSVAPKLNRVDTIPDKEKKVKDFDDALKELDKSEMELEHTIKNFKIPKPAIPSIPPIEAEKIRAEVEQAIKAIDVQKIQAEVQASIAKIDMEKIKLQLEEVKKTDFAKIEVELQNIKPQIESSLKAAQAEIEKVKDIELPRINKQLEEMKPQIQNAMQEARKGIEKAKKEMEGYKTFVDDLDKEGLINKKDNYTIEYKNGALIINGKTMPASLYNKYQNFLKNHPSFIIKKDAEGLNINTNEQNGKGYQ